MCSRIHLVTLDSQVSSCHIGCTLQAFSWPKYRRHRERSSVFTGNKKSSTDTDAAPHTTASNPRPKLIEKTLATGVDHQVAKEWAIGCRPDHEFVSYKTMKGNSIFKCTHKDCPVERHMRPMTTANDKLYDVFELGEHINDHSPIT